MAATTRQSSMAYGQGCGEAECCPEDEFATALADQPEVAQAWGLKERLRALNHCRSRRRAADELDIWVNDFARDGCLPECQTFRPGLDPLIRLYGNMHLVSVSTELCFTSGWYLPYTTQKPASAARLPVQTPPFRPCLQHWQIEIWREYVHQIIHRRNLFV